MLSFGSWQDALFLGVLVSNSLIGIVQEVRAKRALDRLSALVAPTATVLRDGEPRRLPREDVVVGDLVALEPGDQLVADGASSRARASCWTSRSSPASPRASRGHPATSSAPARSSPRAPDATR